MERLKPDPDEFARTIKRLVPAKSHEHIAEKIGKGLSAVERQVYPPESDDTYLFRTWAFIHGYKATLVKHPEFEQEFRHLVSWLIAGLTQLLDEPAEDALDDTVLEFGTASSSVVTAHFGRKPAARHDAAIKAAKAIDGRFYL